MTYEIRDGGAVTVLRVSFLDEGVDLIASITVDGGERATLGYLPFFEADLRRTYAHLFPLPPIPEGVLMP